MDWLQIDVAKLAQPGVTKQVADSGSLTGLRTGLGWVEESEPIRIDLLLQGVDDGIEVGGEVRGRLHLSCSRCLVEYEQDLSVGLDEKFYFEPDLAEHRDGYEVRGEVVDLEPMLRDAIVLSIPITPIHAEGCKGLCPVCGTDLNIAECGHAGQATDPRWAPLARLLASQTGEDEELES